MDEDKERLREKGRGSTGNLEAWRKREREGEEDSAEGSEKWVFQRSKKVIRSPDKGGKEKEQELERGGMEGLKKDLMTGLREIGEEIKKKIEEEIERKMGEELIGRIDKLREEIREEMREREKRWEEEKVEVEKRIKNLEEKVSTIGVEEEKRREEVEGGKEDRESEMGQRIKMLERKWERAEREEKMQNIIVKGIDTEKGNIKDSIEKLLEEIGVEVEIKNTRKVGGTKVRGKGMVVVTLDNREQRRKVMEKKKKLKGRMERIEDDLTWEERKIKWKLREIAREEGKKGKRVWIERNSLRIEGKWWNWDEKEEDLKDEKGEWWREGRGTIEELKAAGEEKGGGERVKR